MHFALHDTTLHITFAGDILSTRVAALRTELLAGLSAHPGAKFVVADLAAAAVIDSQGLNLLVALLRECERRGIAFRVDKPSPDVHRMLTMLNLAARFGLVPTPSAL